MAISTNEVDELTHHFKTVQRILELVEHKVRKEEGLDSLFAIADLLNQSCPQPELQKMCNDL